VGNAGLQEFLADLLREAACARIDDAESLSAQALRARRLRFGAKLCIHARQVAVVEQAFAPSDDEIAWARRVLHAAEAAQGGAVAGRWPNGRPAGAATGAAAAAALASNGCATERPR
jgi:citrate lyase subunit beta/citryl-CoA lyase